MENTLELKELSSQLSLMSVSEGLNKLASSFEGRLIFTTSFGIEDQVITDIIFQKNIRIEVVTFDTGRLFPQTYKTFRDTVTRYHRIINVYFPGTDEVEKMVTKKGPFSFYDSVQNRIECCNIRKVVPLKRALNGKSIWITGIRAAQSNNRNNMSRLEYDNDKQIIKYHPLFDWSLEEVENYIRENEVPYNSLHDKGYKSIGCEPCTRATDNESDLRAGRWWWENNGTKECGFHIK